MLICLTNSSNEPNGIKMVFFTRFLNSKIDGNYAESIKILFNSSINLFNIKNLFLLLAPNIILKKLMWYYNDSN